MANIFRAPADYQHFKDTIEDGRSVDETKSFLHEDEKSRLERIVKNGVVRYWGSLIGESNSRNFEKLQVVYYNCSEAAKVTSLLP